MKFIATVALMLSLVACNNDSKPLVKSETKTDKPTEPIPSTAVVIPVVKFGIEGFYTGSFIAAKYDESKDVLDNKITVCIDSLNQTMVYGHSVDAGNMRNFQGAYKKQDGKYIVTAKEPGDDKYDGVFNFTIDPKAKKIEGKWKANDPKIAVTEREYELEARSFKYDPALPLSVDVTEIPVYGTYNEKTEKQEAITKDAMKKNASTVVLKSNDVENLYKADLEVMRNAIYARHGYSFKNPRMRVIFDNYVEWYMPVSTDVTAQLTETEKKNIELIKRYEAHATKYYDVFGR